MATKTQGSNPYGSGSTSSSSGGTNKMLLIGLGVGALIVGFILGSLFGGGSSSFGSSGSGSSSLCGYGILNYTNSSHIDGIDALKVIAVNASYKEVNESVVVCSTGLSVNQLSYITSVLNRTS